MGDIDSRSEQTVGAQEKFSDYWARTFAGYEKFDLTLKPADFFGLQPQMSGSDLHAVPGLQHALESDDRGARALHYIHETPGHPFPLDSVREVALHRPEVFLDLLYREIRRLNGSRKAFTQGTYEYSKLFEKPLINLSRTAAEGNLGIATSHWGKRTAYLHGTINAVSTFAQDLLAHEWYPHLFAITNKYLTSATGMSADRRFNCADISDNYVATLARAGLVDGRLIDRGDVTAYAGIKSVHSLLRKVFSDTEFQKKVIETGRELGVNISEIQRQQKEYPQKFFVMNLVNFCEELVQSALEKNDPKMMFSVQALIEKIQALMGNQTDIVRGRISIGSIDELNAFTARFGEFVNKFPVRDQIEFHGKLDEFFLSVEDRPGLKSVRVMVRPEDFEAKFHYHPRDIAGWMVARYINEVHENSLLSAWYGIHVYLPAILQTDGFEIMDPIMKVAPKEKEILGFEVQIVPLPQINVMHRPIYLGSQKTYEEARFENVLIKSVNERNLEMARQMLKR